MSQNINFEFIERYQNLYQKDPSSKVFAPLGEAYRKMGMYKEALDVLRNGVSKHPNFSSGRVALAKVLMEQSNYQDAIQHLKAAVDLSAENIMAHRLLAECYVKVRQPKQALRSYKMTLFLNPNDTAASEAISKFESLTADEYEDEIFEMRPLIDKTTDKKETISPMIEQKISTFSNSPNPILRERQMERILSLVDAFIARGDLGKASEVLKQGAEKLGPNPEFEKRTSFIKSRVYMEPIEIEESISPTHQNKSEKPQKKIDFLQRLLQRIEDRRV